MPGAKRLFPKRLLRQMRRTRWIVNRGGPSFAACQPLYAQKARLALRMLAGAMSAIGKFQQLGTFRLGRSVENCFSIIGTRHGINNFYAKTLERRPHPECWLHFDGKVRRRALVALFTDQGQSHHGVLMVEPLHLEIFDVEKLEPCERVMPKNQESLPINLFCQFPDMDRQRQHGKVVNAFIGLNVAAPKVKL